MLKHSPGQRSCHSSIFVSERYVLTPKCNIFDLTANKSMLRALSIWYLSCCGILCNAIHLGQQIGNLLLQLIYGICSVVWTCVLVICCLFLVASCQRCTHNSSVNGLPPLLKQLLGQHETCSHPTSVDLLLSLSVCCASKNQSNAAGNAIEIVCTNHARRHQLHHANRDLRHSTAQHSTAQRSAAQEAYMS